MSIDVSNKKKPMRLKSLAWDKDGVMDVDSSFSDSFIFAAEDRFTLELVEKHSTIDETST